MKIPAIVLVLLINTLTLSAQVERKPIAIKPDSTQATVSDNKADKLNRKERLKELDLTKEQKSKMKEIMQAGKASKDAIQNNTQLSETEKKKQLRDLQKAQMQKIQAILTPEQIEKFKAGKPNNP